MLQRCMIKRYINNKEFFRIVGWLWFRNDFCIRTGSHEGFCTVKETFKARAVRREQQL